MLIIMINLNQVTKLKQNFMSRTNEHYKILTNAKVSVTSE